MFEALVFVENPDDVFLVLVGFYTGYQDYAPFSINEMDYNDIFYYPIPGDLLVTIRTDQILSVYDNKMVYQFQLECLSNGIRTILDISSVMLYEIGQLL